MKKIIISICLIIIFFLIFFSYNTYENFNFSVNKTKYTPQYVGPILFYDYNDNNIGSYPDDKIWPDFFKKKDNKYINLLGAGKPFDIKFPKAKKGTGGLKGYKGLDGDIGAPGIKGLEVTGPQGPVGPIGDRGAIGETGGCGICPKGDTGETGNKGETGDQGDDGETGERPLKNEAETGIRGEIGAMGPTSTLKGITGQQGPRGPRGDKGLPGNVIAHRGSRGFLNPIINDDYLQINRQEDVNSPRQITIGNNRTRINIDTNTVFINKNFCIEKNGIEQCINKDDIKRLYEFNNPKCTCPNGIVVNTDKCFFNGVACKSCTPGYYKQKTSINGKWIKNKQSTICKKCDSSKCGANKYLTNCGGDNPGECKTCDRCPAGQHRVNCGGNSTGTCVQNTCNCPGGNAAGGSACTSNGANICASCHGGYYKSGNNCYYKQCTCTDGTAASGTRCPNNGQHRCISCKSNNYSLRNGLCTYNQIYMFKDVGYTGENRWIGGANNTCQNLRDLRYNYSKGSKMDNNMSSFKKDPNAGVTLFYKRGCEGECYDLSGHGNKNWVGKWWNDDVAAVGYGMPCNNHKGFVD